MKRPYGSMTCRQELLDQAARARNSGEAVKHWVVSNVSGKIHPEIYAADSEPVSDLSSWSIGTEGPGNYHIFANYWHAYAYALKVKRKLNDQ